MKKLMIMSAAVLAAYSPWAGNSTPEASAQQVDRGAIQARVEQLRAAAQQRAQGAAEAAAQARAAAQRAAAQDAAQRRVNVENIRNLRIRQQGDVNIVRRQGNVIVEGAAR